MLVAVKRQACQQAFEQVNGGDHATQHGPLDPAVVVSEIFRDPGRGLHTGWELEEMVPVTVAAETRLMDVR